MKKRILSLLLCLVMCVSLLPTSVMAADDSVKITKVAITDVPTPIAGAYTAISASDVTITTEPANAVTVADIYWSNFFDSTNSTAKVTDETFTVGKSYCLGLVLSPKEGYCFEWDSNWPENYTGTATFDGQAPRTAWSSMTVDDALYMESKSMTATLPQKITKVAITDVPTPKAGAYTAISASDVTITTEPANAVTVADIYWSNFFDSTNSTSKVTDKMFTAGKKYCLSLVLSPKDGYCFEWDSSPFQNYTGTATFDGQAPHTAWSSVTVDDALYTFSKSMTATLSKTQYDVYANGEQFTSDKLIIKGDSGTATYDPTAGTITLNGYSGGAIRAEKGDLIINVTGTNKITVSHSDNEYGICVSDGDLTISGGGDLEVDLSSEASHSAIISSPGALTVDMAGDLTVKSQHTALYGYAGLTISGSGDVTVIKKGTTAASGIGILAHENNVTISGSGTVTVDSDNSAVGLGDPNGELKLEGTGSLISLTAGDGYKAVDNFIKRTSPVGGSALSNYAETGAPYEQSVVYKLAYPVYANGERFTVDKPTINGDSGTATYDPATGTVTLNGYTGGVIKAEKGNLIINVTGTNKVTTADSEKDFGIRVIEGDLIISGDGDLEVDLSSDPSHSAIVTENGSLTVNMAGDLTVKSQHTALYGYAGLTISGSGDVTVIKKGTGIGVGLLAYENDVTISGSGKVSVDSDTSAVGLRDPNGELKLEGTSALISLTAGDGSKAVDNFTAKTSPVGGSTLSNYAVIGAPDTQSVVYKFVYPVYANGEQFSRDKLTINGSSGTATYDPATGTVTLNGYIGGAIRAEKGDLTINVTGTNKVTTADSEKNFGIRVIEGDLIISGDGDLEVDLSSDPSHSAIVTENGSLTVNMAGDLTVKSQHTALYGYAGLTISGSGDVTVIKKGTTIGAGILAYENNVTISGSGTVSVDADVAAVGLRDSNGELKLEGTGSLISLTAGDGFKAVDSFMVGSSPVGGSALSNYAETGAPYEQSVVYKLAYPVYVWVDGKQFTKDNLTIECGSGTATYDPFTATVTLNNAQITQTHKESDGFSGAIYAKQALTVKVIGDSTISLGAYTTGEGIYTTGNLTITGDKALNISTGNEYVDAVWVNGADLTVNMNGDLTVTAAGTALSATGNVTLAGNGSSTINAGADANGIYSSGADITLSGSGNVTIDAGYGIYAQTGNAVISGSGDIVIDAKKNGFKVFGNLTVGGSGKLTVDAGSYGLLCDNMIFTGERTADITAGEDGIVPAGEIELGGSGDITITANVYGINVYYNGDVNISGSGKLTITAGNKGIVSYNGAILSGSGEVEVYGKENAVYFDSEQGAVRLDGTGSPITLSADEGKMAVYNITTHQSPIAGTAFDAYKCVTGAPDTASVVYRLEHSYGETTYTWDNGQCTAARTCTVCDKTETETATGIYAEDTPATCTEPSKGHYRTIFLNVLFENQNTEANSVTHGSPLGHAFPETWEKHDAEQHKHTCTRCENAVEYEAHEWNDVEVTKPATHTAEGVKTYTCSKCGETKTETIEKLKAHTYDQEVATEDYLKSAATCTEAAVYYKSCICGEKGTETFTSGEALGHNYQAERYSIFQHKLVCKNDATHVYYENHDFVGNMCRICGYMKINGDGIAHYTLTFNTNGGSSIGNVAASYGKEIDLGAYRPTKEGYDFGGWYLDKALTVPAEKVALTANRTVYAKWNEKTPDVPEAPVFPFTDVISEAWSYGDIYYAWENELMNGVSETTFAPKMTTTRAMIVTILWRLEGEPVVNYAMTFEDVGEEEWYTEAIRWAQANNIVNGYSAEKFGPTDLITREQMAAILYRYAQTRGEGFTGSWMFLLDFEDRADISSWADEAMHWCVMKNIISGVGNNLLAPQGNATREQVAAILHRFCENIVK